MLLLYYMEINKETRSPNRHLTLKIVDLHHEELSKSFKDNLFASYKTKLWREQTPKNWLYNVFIYKKFKISRALLAFF